MPYSGHHRACLSSAGSRAFSAASCDRLFLMTSSFSSYRAPSMALQTHKSDENKAMIASGTVSESYHSIELRLNFGCKQDIGASIIMTNAKHESGSYPRRALDSSLPATSTVTINSLDLSSSLADSEGSKLTAWPNHCAPCSCVA